MLELWKENRFVASNESMNLRVGILAGILLTGYVAFDSYRFLIIL